MILLISLFSLAALFVVSSFFFVFFVGGIPLPD